MGHVVERGTTPPKISKTAWVTGLLPKMAKVLVTAAIVGGTVLSTSAELHAAAGRPYIVNNDRGGFISDRLRELRNLEASGRRVEIRGQICYSTCTMLLGLPNTCISPHTQFGFHGPSKSGRRLAPERFDFYSRVIAQYYPPKLNAWYMSTGRNRIDGIYRISGRDIIRMGVKAC